MEKPNFNVKRKHISFAVFIMAGLLFMTTCFCYARSSRMVNMYNHHQSRIYYNVPIRVKSSSITKLKNANQYSFKVSLLHPKTGQDLILTADYYCLHEVAQSHCDHLMKHYVDEENTSKFASFWDTKPYPTIHFRHVENEYLFNMLDWVFYFKVNCALVISCFSLALVFYFYHGISNKRVQFILLITLGIIFLASFISISQSSYEHHSHYHNWLYKETNLVINHVSKTLEERNAYMIRGRPAHIMNFTKYTIHYRPNMDFIKQYNINVPSSVIECPNEKFMNQYQDPMKACIEHYEKYYKPGNVVNAHFSKVDPTDIIIDNVTNTYSLIENALIYYMYLFWFIALGLVSFSGFLVHKEKMKTT